MALKLKIDKIYNLHRATVDWLGSRIRLFGSALTDRFDPERSDVDLLVEFQGGIEDPFDAYFEDSKKISKPTLVEALIS